jgi:hypothetical protein
MNEDAFDSVCSHLEAGQLIRIKTASGSRMLGYVIKCERALANTILFVERDGETFGLTAPQTMRIIPYDEQTEDTLPPELDE